MFVNRTQMQADLVAFCYNKSQIDVKVYKGSQYEKRKKKCTFMKNTSGEEWDILKVNYIQLWEESRVSCLYSGLGICMVYILCILFLLIKIFIEMLQSQEQVTFFPLFLWILVDSYLIWKW